MNSQLKFIFQSGQPFVNSDGSVYRYDPSNPPHLAVPSTVSSHSSASAVHRENSKDDPGL